MGGGGVSMEMYIFHSLVIAGLRLVEAIGQYTPPAWLNIVLVYVLTLAVAVGYHRYIAPRILMAEQKVLSCL